MRMIQIFLAFLWVNFGFYNNLSIEDYAEKLILNIFNAIENYLNQNFH